MRRNHEVPKLLKSAVSVDIPQSKLKVFPNNFFPFNSLFLMVE